MAITPAPSRAGTSVKSRCSKTGTQPRQHGEANPGTVRAFHEEARTVRLTSPAAEAAHSKCAQARFESGVSLDRGVALNGEKSAPRYSRPGSRPGLPHEDTVRTPRTSSDPTVPYPQAGPTRIGSPAVAGHTRNTQAIHLRHPHVPTAAATRGARDAAPAVHRRTRGPHAYAGRCTRWHEPCAPA